MLRSLHIENIAVVERADVEFSPGLNVLTGETGAGKSIIIDALYAVAGARTSRELVRSGADKCVAAAVFDPEGTEDWCRENGVELSDGELVVQRSVTADGRGSARVNGMPVAVSQLRQLGALLVDIHGQNDGRLLLDEGRHLGYLDAFAAVDRSAYAAQYRGYTDVLRRIERLTLDDADRRQLAEALLLRVAELEKAALRPGEEEELEQRSELLRNAERLREAADGAYEALYAGESSAVSLTGEARGWLDRVRRWSGELAAADGSLKEAAALLADAAERVRDFRESLDFSPEEFDRVESRLSLLRRLEKKYNAADAAGLLAVYEEAALALVNTVYFKGAWSEEFDENFTQKGEFTRDNGEKTETDFMRRVDDFRYWALEDGAQAIRLPYKGHEKAFLAILPPEGVSADEYLNALSAGTLSNLMKSGTSAKVNLRMPRIDAACTFDMKDFLRDMGVTCAFDPAQAQFGKMLKGNEPVWIGQILQKTRLKLDEKGTEASAATIISMEAGSARIPEEPIELTLDRSFLYIIYDENADVPLFMGKVTNP